MLTYPRLADSYESLTPFGTYCLRQSTTFISYFIRLVNFFFSFFVSVLFPYFLCFGDVTGQSRFPALSCSENKAFMPLGSSPLWWNPYYPVFPCETGTLYYLIAANRTRFLPNAKLYYIFRSFSNIFPSVLIIFVYFLKIPYFFCVIVYNQLYKRQFQVLLRFLLNASCPD